MGSRLEHRVRVTREHLVGMGWVDQPVLTIDIPQLSGAVLDLVDITGGAAAQSSSPPAETTDFHGLVFWVCAWCATRVTHPTLVLCPNCTVPAPSPEDDGIGRSTMN